MKTFSTPKTKGGDDVGKGLRHFYLCLLVEGHVLVPCPLLCPSPVLYQYKELYKGVL